MTVALFGSEIASIPRQRLEENFGSERTLENGLVRASTILGNPARASTILAIQLEPT